MAEIEVYEVLRLVSDKRAEVATNDTVPGRAFTLIELYCGQSPESDSRVSARTVFLICIAMS